MPVFAYKGIDSAGKDVRGIKDADTAKALRTMLRRDGIFLTEFNEAKAGKAAAEEEKGKGLSRQVEIGLFNRVSQRDVAIFTRQLSVLLISGVPLAESLNTLAEQYASTGKRKADKLQRVLADLRRQVNEGTSLADALTNHPEVFRDVYINMVRSGESAGNLEQVLSRLADFIERSVELRSKVVGALLYPGIVLVFVGGVMIILMTVVLPQLTQIFADMKKSLAWHTKLLLTFQGAFESYWWLMLAMFVGGIVAFNFWRRSPGGKPKWHRIMLHAPVAGSVVRALAIGRFTRTLGTTFSAGVPLLKALDIAKYVLGNVVLEKVVDAAQRGIREGESIAAMLKKSDYFEPMVVHMIAVGERSGQLPEMLMNVASAYEKQVEIRLERLAAMLAPIIIVLMGVVVLFAILAIVSPILQMANI